MWVYLESEPGVWTVGWSRPTGEWVSVKDFHAEEAAAYCVHYLNAGKPLHQFLADERGRPR